MTREAKLGGRVVLVVEDEWFVAEDIAAAIRREGARVAGPVATAAEALRLIGGERIDLAVLDIGLDGLDGLTVAEALAERGVPFVFATGYEAADLPARFADTPHWDKPFDSTALARFLERMNPGTRTTS